MALAGKTAIVTGSTSGIGKAIAAEFLREGMNVVVNYSHDERRADLARREFAEISDSFMIIRADVATSAGAQSLATAAVTHFGGIDALVNNAAMAADRPVLDLTESDWDRVLAVNLRGPFLCSQAAARVMLDQQSGGSIVNIGASTGIRARRNGANTCASKAGLLLLTQALALELAPTVRVNTVIPGLVETADAIERFGLSDPTTRAARVDAVPLGRLCTPADVARSVVILLSPDASFITGQRVVVDGGQNMW